MERTAQDFVDDMLTNGRSWIAITAVGAVVRNGRWKEEVKTILQERRLMPMDEQEIIRLKIDAAKRVIAEPPKYTTSKSLASKVK